MRNTNNFLTFMALIIMAVCLYFFYLDAKERINAMQKNPKVIEYDSLRKKHFNLK